MDFYDFDQKPKRPRIFSYLVIALIGAVIGGIMVSCFLPDILALREEGEMERPGMPHQQDEQEEQSSQDLKEEKAADYHEHQNTAVVAAAEEVTPAVVGITNLAMGYDFFQGRTDLHERASGSGVIIDSDGYIVTNYHVIANATEIAVTMENGDEHEAEIIGADPGTDLAVLKIDKTGLPSANFSDSDNLQVGELAIAIGNPLGLAFKQSVTVGVISALDRSITIGEQTFSFIQTDAAINDGNSGGALTNAIGEVIGINTAKIKIPGVEGMGFAIPSNTVESIVAELIEHGRIIRPWIGVVVSEIDEHLAEQLQLPVDYGVLVEDTVAGDPADQAGIRSGDIIIEMAGEKIETFTRLREVINQHEVGDEVSVKILRNGQERELSITFIEMPRQEGQ